MYEDESLIPNKFKVIIVISLITACFVYFYIPHYSHEKYIELGLEEVDMPTNVVGSAIDRGFEALNIGMSSTDGKLQNYKNISIGNSAIITIGDKKIDCTFKGSLDSTLEPSVYPSYFYVGIKILFRDEKIFKIKQSACNLEPAGKG